MNKELLDDSKRHTLHCLLVDSVNKHDGDISKLDVNAIAKKVGEAYDSLTGLPMVNTTVVVTNNLCAEASSQTNYDFGTALQKLKDGYQLRRINWNGKGLWVELQVPDAGSKMTVPYFYLNKVTDNVEYRVPWVPSVTDILANDWIIEGKSK